MIQGLLLFTLFIAGCSSHQHTRDELVKLSVSHQSYPVKDKNEARNFINQQRSYLTELYLPFKNSTMPEHCRTEKFIGNVLEKKHEIFFISKVRIDSNGKSNACENISQTPVWNVFSYCEGDKAVMNFMILLSHLPELKDKSLCR